MLAFFVFFKSGMWRRASGPTTGKSKSLLSQKSCPRLGVCGGFSHGGSLGFFETWLQVGLGLVVGSVLFKEG